MTDQFIKDTLKVVVAQICQTIGWSSINSSAMEILIDVLRRYLLEMAKTTHNYSDLFGRTRPNIDDLGLAFSEMGIDVRELREYVEFVESVPCNLAVPKFPVFKESHLNFLKPGSKEVVTRPVHVNEHLPPTVELTVDATSDLANSPQPSPTFKRPGDPVDGAAKRARLGLEEEGRPLREISSVMMTTGGFISPAREGKLPEPKWTLPASDLRSQSPPAPHYPSVPKEVFREKKKRPPDGKLKEKTKKIKHGSSSGDKKLTNMKAAAKLKAFKSNVNKVSSSLSPQPPKPSVHTPEKTLLQKLAESPHLVVTPVPSEPPPPVVKLATEPDKQKLNIFKKISKVKDDEPPPPPPPVKEFDTSFSSPGSPSTPKTPDILRSPEPKKKKKDKEKKKKRQDNERVRPEPIELERRPKTPEIVQMPAPPFPAPFPFYQQVPPAIANPLIPRFPLPLGPNFPNLPLPPFLNPGLKPDLISDPPASSTSKSPLAILLDREKKGKEHKKEKKDKKKKDRKDKPKKDKKEKRHGEEKHKSKDKKEKKEKRKEKEREREREKEREKEKDKEKERDREKEKEKEKAKEKQKEDTPVPKLTLKIASASSSPRPPSPRKLTEKSDEEPRRSAPKPTIVEEPKRPSAKAVEVVESRAEGSEIARISSLFSKPLKSDTKPLHVQTESLKIPKEAPLQKSPGTIIDADGNKVWICPACGKPDDGTPMIGCDECDAWYHWICVGIHEAPDENDDWYCRFCIVKKQGSSGRKKRGRRRKEHS